MSSALAGLSYNQCLESPRVKKHHGYDWCERNPEGQGNMSGATLKPTMELGSHGVVLSIAGTYVYSPDHTVTTQANGVMLCW